MRASLPGKMNGLAIQKESEESVRIFFLPSDSQPCFFSPVKSPDVSEEVIQGHPMAVQLRKKYGLQPH